MRKINHKKILKPKVFFLAGAFIVIFVLILAKQQANPGFQNQSQNLQNPQELDIKYPKRELTAEEKSLLSPPSENASKSAKQKHAAIVKKLAQKTSLIEIKSCQPYPLVAELKQGSVLEVVNKDSERHFLFFDSKHFNPLEPNSTTKITVNFKYGAADYGFVCDQEGIVGFLHIIP